MSANPNDPRTQRRKMLGDDPNKISMSPQPLPGSPQDGTGGNMMNYPAVDMDGQMSQLMGRGGGQMPYGDMGLSPDDGRLGNVGFVQNSGQAQNVVPGRGQNMDLPYNQRPALSTQEMETMEPMYDMASALGKTMPGGINNNQPVSYNVTALGPTGSATPLDPKTSPQLTYSDDRQLGLQGFKSAEEAVDQRNQMGMSTGRGGGRNQGTN